MADPVVPADAAGPNARVEQMFPTLTRGQIERIAAQSRRRSVERGEVLYDAGDTALHFFVVIAGKVGVVRPSESGET